MAWCFYEDLKRKTGAHLSKSDIPVDLTEKALAIAQRVNDTIGPYNLLCVKVDSVIDKKTVLLAFYYTVLWRELRSGDSAAVTIYTPVTPDPKWVVDRP